MQIHRVLRGESLWTIARQYGSTPEAIGALNGLSNDNAVVPGLNLLIPGATPVLPRARTGKKSIEVNGYLLPSGANDTKTVDDVASELTYLCIFSYQATASGQLTAPQPDTPALTAALNQGVRPLVTVTNFDGTNFNPELAHTILSDNTVRSTLITNIRNLLRNKGYAGVNVDFEHMLPGDRPVYNNFIRTLGAAVRQDGKSISIAMGPKTSDAPTQSWMGAFDYRALGQAVDFLMLMTYEWGWVGGPPMAIAPIDQVKAVLNYATSVIDPAKILMGFALYGYDWPLPHPAAGRASGISNNAAQNLAVRTGSNVMWNSEAQSPFFTYDATGGRQHEVWYEDAASIAAKLQLVYDLNLRGVSYWVLGNPFPQNWALIPDNFNVVRY